MGADLGHFRSLSVGAFRVSLPGDHYFRATRQNMQPPKPFRFRESRARPVRAVASSSGPGDDPAPACRRPCGPSPQPTGRTPAGILFTAESCGSHARAIPPDPGNRSTNSSPGRAPNRSKIHRAKIAGFAPITRPGSVRRAPGRYTRASSRRAVVSGDTSGRGPSQPSAGVTAARAARTVAAAGEPDVSVAVTRSTRSRPPVNTTGSHAVSGPRLRVGRSPRTHAPTRTPAGQTARTPGNAAADVDNAHPSELVRQRRHKLGVVYLATIVCVVAVVLPGEPRIWGVGVGEP